MNRQEHIAGVRAIAALECAKGMLVVLIGFGVFTLAHHHQLDFEDMAGYVLRALHLNPVHHVSRIFLRSAERLDDVPVVRLAVGAAFYSLLRFVEAYGLWHARKWAEWFAIISGGAYLPLEIYELTRRITYIRVVVLLLNLVIVLYLLHVRLQERRRTLQAAAADARAA